MRGWLLGLAGMTVVIAGVWSLGAWRWAVRSRDLLAQLESARSAPRAGRFDPSLLEGLPEPIAGHLRRAVPPGSPMIHAVRLAHRGQFNLSSSGERWVPFTSHQQVVAQRPGFVWDARMSVMPGLPVHVHDACVAGEGRLEAALWGLWPLALLRDRDEVARGELMRFLAEAAWYPTALLPRPGLVWEPVDARQARATLSDGPIRVTLTFHVGSDGLIDTIRADQRGRTVDGQVVPTPWEGRMSNYQRREGLLVPMDGEVAWLTPQGRLPYWRGTIVDLQFDPRN